jgi:hypothetical protein
MGTAVARLQRVTTFSAFATRIGLLLQAMGPGLLLSTVFMLGK